MLKRHEESTDRGWVPASRLLAAVLLASIASGVWILPTTVQGGDGEKSADAEKATKPAPVTRSDTPAFDLSYISDDAMGVVAFHPAATFRRQGMAQYAGQLNALTAMKGLDEALEIPVSKCPLKIEQIEQVTAVVKLDRTVQHGKDMGRMMFHCLTIRTVEPFDWLKLVRSWWPNAVQVHEGEKVYYKFHYPALGPNPCFYFPDNRTVVCDEEPVILGLIRRQAPAAPEFARGDDWKKVEHDLFAVVLDNQASQAIRKSLSEDENQIYGEFFKPTNHWVMGLANADDFLVRLLVTCREPSSIKTIAKLVTKMRDSCLEEFHKPRKDTSHDDLRIAEYIDQILKGLRVEEEQTCVRIETSGGVKLADLLPLIAKNGL